MDLSGNERLLLEKSVFPDDKHIPEVVDRVYERIEKAEIWIPYGEVLRHYKKKRADIHKRVRKSLQGQKQDRTEKCVL